MKIIGHRGARGLAPENTLAAFEKALHYRVDEIELDVRVSLDLVVLVHHDEYLRDQSGNALFVAGHTYNELLAHKADLCTLERAVRFINKRVPILVEVKPDVPVKPVTDALEGLVRDGWESQNFLLGSFSQKTLRQLHHQLPAIEKVVIERWSGVRGTWRARQLGAKRINMNHLWLWSGFIKSMRRSGYRLAPYTLNDASKARRWAEYGIDAVITDYPDRFDHK